MLIISLCNMLMISCKDPEAKKQKRIKLELSQMRQRCPSLVKMKTELIKEAKSTRRGVKSYVGSLGDSQPTSQVKH